MGIYFHLKPQHIWFTSWFPPFVICILGVKYQCLYFRRVSPHFENFICILGVYFLFWKLHLYFGCAALRFPPFPLRSSSGGGLSLAALILINSPDRARLYWVRDTDTSTSKSLNTQTRIIKVRGVWIQLQVQVQDFQKCRFPWMLQRHLLLHVLLCTLNVICICIF